jgi:hypothetical protein
MDKCFRATRPFLFLNRFFLKSQTKTFNFDNRLKRDICVRENNKEKHMLSHVFYLTTNDVNVTPRNARKIDYNSKN